MTATNCRNPKLAMIFNRLSLMEGVGSGFNKIQACYSHVKFSDLLTIGETMFVIHLPSLNFAQGYLQKKKLVFTGNKGQNLPDFGLYY